MNTCVRITATAVVTLGGIVGMLSGGVANAASTATVSFAPGTSLPPTSFYGATLTPVNASQLTFSPSTFSGYIANPVWDGWANIGTYVIQMPNVGATAETMTVPANTRTFAFDVAGVDGSGAAEALSVTADSGTAVTEQVPAGGAINPVTQVIVTAAPGQTLHNVTVQLTETAYNNALDRPTFANFATSATRADVPALQTVTETVNGASLGFVSTPGAVTPPATTLNGVDEVTPSFSLPLDIGDATGSGNGWNVSLNATPFTDSQSRTLGHLYQSTEPVPTCDASTTCTAASDITHLVSTVNPLTYSAGNLVQVADTATGMGDQSVSPTFTLAVPANSYAGDYTSTWTVSLNSAPH